MDNYKQKHVFHQTQSQQDAEELQKKQTFDSSDFVTQDATLVSDGSDIETDIEQALKPQPKKLRLRMLALLFGGLLVWQLVDSFIEALDSADYLALAWIALWSIISCIGLGALIRELIKLRRLKGQADLQQQSQVIAKQNGYGQALPFCEQLNKGLFANNVETPMVEKFEAQVLPTHSDNDILDLYQASVLEPIDSRVSRLIAKYSSEAAVMVAVSPIAIADMALVVWRSLAMVSAISKSYGVELGYWSRIKLLRSIFINMAAAGGSELVIDAGIDFLSMDMTAKLSSRAAQGIGVGLLTARLGIKTAELTRPISFTPKNQLKLSHVRNRILGAVKQRLQLSITKNHDKV
ncbi:YcjF family protein [Vibrio gallicus]|uniref:YcjF family protein n=1 Tax=Vibrio gallicus TaxID=190897 RepID=UPI0021C31843|nr:YcjF family protein [Vibrio gallicus]